MLAGNQGSGIHQLGLNIYFDEYVVGQNEIQAK